jgi:(S)-2-hydroxyglutarate dehydrogenase
MTGRCDVVVVGGGIVGLASAYALAYGPKPPRRVVVVEKERDVALHQSGRNSGVIHSGIYYKPGSLKAQTCREGRLAMMELCREEGIPFRICGKVIVAADDAEAARLPELVERGRASGVACELIDSARLREIEPHVAGVGAIHVSDAGVVDYREVCHHLTAKLRARGHDVVTAAKVTAVHHRDESVVVETTAGEVQASSLVNCAGVYSDRVARLAGTRPSAQIVPFRGEYFAVAESAARLCLGLIYPVPDPRFPFLGVHFTRSVHDEVECGPNAVFAFAREGYDNSIIDMGDLFESLTYSGFLRMAARHWSSGLEEMWRSLSKRAFLRAVQRLVPEIEERDLTPAPAGIRAQAVGRDGHLIDDFVIIAERRAVHLVNAPSPGATASLAIGRRVAEEVAALG